MAQLRNYCKILSLSVFCFARIWASSSIVTTDNFAALEALAKSAEDHSHTLVLLDFAKVMCTHKDPWMLGHKKKRHATNSIKHFSNPHSPQAQAIGPHRHKKLLTIFHEARRYRLIDQKLPRIIHQLQRRGIKVIALTSFKAGGTPRVKNHRYAALQKQGIDFSGAFPRHQDLVLSGLQKNGKSPTFSKGILSNAGVFSKGDVLRAFFDAIGWQPTRVIFYDDRMDNLDSVQQALYPLNIGFQGFLYTGFKKLPAFFDKDIAEYQVKHLIKHERWISGKKAKQLLKR